MARGQDTSVEIAVNGANARTNVAIASLAVVAIVVSVLTFNTELRWLGHAAVSIIGTGFVLWIVTTGSIITGRIKKSHEADTLGTHRKMSIWFAILMLATFAYGLSVRLEHGEPMLATAHGWFGLAITVMAVAQVVPSLVVKDRKGIRSWHRMLGYSLAVVVVLQSAYGVYVAVLATVKPLVLAHSVTGAIAAMALVWIIVELRHLKANGMRRIAKASYLAAVFTTLGCWVLGGINYMTAYRSEVRAVILAGDQPWAHEVFMEAKEHIFLFLPIISFLLVLSIVSSGKGGEILGSQRVRSIIILASLALCLTIAMFLMGFLISNAGSLGAGGA